MNKVQYSKPPLTFQEQLQQLQDRGMIFEDEPKALHLLETVSYYRLSGYWYPLLTDKQNIHLNLIAASPLRFSYTASTVIYAL